MEIGNYTVIRELGRGGMGLVYEAQERMTGRLVALKVMHDRIAASPRGRELFQHEMSILATLDHPNIVRLLAGFEHAGQFVMALELVRGLTLRQFLLQRGPLPWTDAVVIARQILSGLVAAHERIPPVVHRDLKPVNVMLTFEGVVKVMDFGIAKVVQGETNATTDVGTLRYMSPEQIDGGLIDARADLYAVGLLLFELLTGAPPFQSQSTRELLTLQCTAPVPPLPPEVAAATPPDLYAIVQALLGKSAAERPASARVALTMLESLGAPPGLSAPVGHSPNLDVAPAPASNFPGASGWSTASSWDQAQSSGWRPTGATGGVSLPNAPIPGISQWGETYPSVAGQPSSGGPVRPQSRMRAGWLLILVPVLAAIGVGGFFALREDLDVPSLASHLAPKGSLVVALDDLPDVCRDRPLLRDGSSVNGIFEARDLDGDGVEDVIVRIVRPTGDTAMQSLGALSANTDVLWRTEEIDARDWFADPIVASDVVLQSDRAKLSAFDVHTGELRWSRMFDRAVTSAAVLDDQTTTVRTDDGRLYSIHTTSGKDVPTPENHPGLISKSTGFKVDPGWQTRNASGAPPGLRFKSPIQAASTSGGCQSMLSESCLKASNVSLFDNGGTYPEPIIVGSTPNWSHRLTDFDASSTYAVRNEDFVVVVDDDSRSMKLQILDAKTGTRLRSHAWDGGWHIATAAMGQNLMFLNAECFVAIDLVPETTRSTE